MIARSEVDALLRELYAARVRGDLERACELFCDDAKFEIAAASEGNPTAVNSRGTAEFRPLLMLLMRTFKITDQAILAMIIDGSKAAVHWQAQVYSRITGAIVRTEFMDIVEIQDGRVSSYIEFFAPR
ncbi:MAG TPA: nuclear transport factor 2 family protein [Candidatus Binataceae bacterium]|jgi:ketosteroid isomerase-like protein|nr:nuclear transport factor 2 family protein [Candidatus Binataceae bacterium]